MKLKELELNDILLVEGKPYKRTGWFSCEDSAGAGYYKLEGEDPFKRFDGWESIAHFSENVYILEQEARKDETI